MDMGRKLGRGLCSLLGRGLSPNLTQSRRDISYERWDNKSSFNSTLSQHLCQKLPKSVEVRWSYSVQHQCRFLRHSVLIICSCFKFYQQVNKKLLDLVLICYISNRMETIIETISTKLAKTLILLWHHIHREVSYGHPIVQAIIFCDSGFFFLFFLAYSQRLQIGCLPYFHTWCGLGANLEFRTEMCCTRLAENTGHKNYAKICRLHTIAQNTVGLYLHH